MFAIKEDLLGLMSLHTMLDKNDQYIILLMALKELRQERMDKWYWEETLWEDIKHDVPLFDIDLDIDNMPSEEKTKISKN